ncbi:hypothetical protein [Halomonas sp. MES3-P3E]|uniref:hypothetical protein n=1 Tax=Halomonas sp. MES3-P3E TaxID=2058321 RepID=UPI000C323F15|nr:hypothetical protein [Halomonas sp. MES3-P3E]PKG53810.1 hypothetical protein CXF87_06725 [Halomonas sp. MES3-P3E]
MRKVIGNVGILVVVVALLAGCSDMEEPSTDTVSSAQPEATPEAPVTESEIAEVEVEPLVVEISTQVALRNDRRLMVEGKSNLPDGTQVRIVVEREISRVRWQARTQIENGQFAAGPFGSGSGLPDGGYDVRVEVSEGSVQPVAVQARIGHEGQHLAGELVSQSRHGLGQVATYSQRFLVGSEPRQTRDQVEVLESPGR